MEKRPLGFIGAMFFLTMVVLSRFGFEKSLYILPVFVIAVFLIFLKQKLIKFFAIITSSILCACIVFYVVDTEYKTKAEYFAGEQISVEGVLCERPYFDGENYVLLVETDKVNSSDVSMKVIAKSRTLPEKATLYNKVSFIAEFYKTESASNKAKNIVLTGYCENYTLKAWENDSKPLNYYLLSYKYKLVDNIYNFVPNDVGAFIAGITFGEKDLLSKETAYKFNISGTSHLLVVSGLHTAIWSGAVYLFLQTFLSEKKSSLMSIIFLVVYMAFTGFTPSVVRAGVMMILNYLGKIFGERPDALNTTGIAALVLTIINPFSVYNVGTVFSFASVLGILLMNEYVYPSVSKRLNYIKYNFLRKIISFVVSTILVALSAQIFTFPVSVLYNVRFSFISIIGNFLVSVFTTIAMVSGGVGGIFLLFAPDFILTKLVFGTSIIFSRIILHITEKLSVLDEFYINVTTIENYILLIFAGIILFLLVFTHFSRKKKIAVFSLLLIPCFFISNFIPVVYRNVYVEFAVLDVGQGLCVTFTNNGETVMLGCGTDNYYPLNHVYNYLELRKVDKIKALYLPVDQKTRLVTCARKISEDYEVESAVTSSEYKFSFVCDNVTSADKVTADYFQGKLKIDYYTYKDNSFALATIGDTRILINFYGSLNKENLPHSCINPDIYVTMNADSYKTDFSATKEYILSAFFEEHIPKSAENIHITRYDSDYIKAIKY